MHSVCNWIMHLSVRGPSFFKFFVRTHESTNRKFKIRTLLILLCCICYSWACKLNQVYEGRLGKSWKDEQITVFKLSLSLKSLLLNSLSNLILFIGKQSILMWLHPNKASLEIYPRTKWVDSKGAHIDV